MRISWLDLLLERETLSYEKREGKRRKAVGCDSDHDREIERADRLVRIGNGLSALDSVLAFGPITNDRDGNGNEENEEGD